jgi:carboxyl-terminal processing protease
MVLKDNEEVSKRTLKNGIKYIKIKSFGDPQFEWGAIDYLYEHKDTRTLIIDVRGNGGGSTPEDLIKALMDRPFREWSEGTPLTIGLFLAYQDLAKRPDLPTGVRNYMDAVSADFYQSQLLWAASIKQPQEPIFTGNLFILVDGACASACGDFVAPFKDNHRATIIGESTMGSSGQPYYYDFGNGMTFRVSTKREYFPDGGAFEGIGVKPDVDVPLTVQDLRGGRDATLLKAEELAGQD